ncbi:MAG: hypothetical protein LBQ47_05525 [Endomicrobium sp.]|nr:hypothetical protein [Endomicrobium sp.]
MSGYYADLKAKLDLQDYKSAAEFVDSSKKKYGKKNILLFYLDSGLINHFADNYSKSSKSFDSAKKQFEFYYTKSISAYGASMVFNDSALPYYSRDYEIAHTCVFEALNYILSSNADEAVVEARRADTMFKMFSANQNGKNFYKDDGFIRYFMGFVYENAGYLNDAHLSYYLALKAYKDGLAEIEPPQDLINDAYTTAVLLNFDERISEIKKSYPSAKKTLIPRGYGECIILDYNGYIPEKIEKTFDFALYDIWPYINEVSVDDQDKRDFDKARSIGVAAFADDYIKVAFPQYKDAANAVNSFSVSASGGNKKSYPVQDFSAIAKKCLKNDTGKIYAKTLARAAVKYVVGKSVSAAVQRSTGDAWGALTQAAFNVYSAVSANADTRDWKTLPDKILMSRFFLPAGQNSLTVNFIGASGEILASKEVGVFIKEGKKNFVVLRSVLN